jgi:hypothetical protein
MLTRLMKNVDHPAGTTQQFSNTMGDKRPHFRTLHTWNALGKLPSDQSHTWTGRGWSNRNAAFPSLTAFRRQVAAFGSNIERRPHPSSFQAGRDRHHRAVPATSAEDHSEESVMSVPAAGC